MAEYLFRWPVWGDRYLSLFRNKAISCYSSPNLEIIRIPTIFNKLESNYLTTGDECNENEHPILPINTLKVHFSQNKKFCFDIDIYIYIYIRTATATMKPRLTPEMKRCTTTKKKLNDALLFCGQRKHNNCGSYPKKGLNIDGKCLNNFIDSLVE